MFQEQIQVLIENSRSGDKSAFDKPFVSTIEKSFLPEKIEDIPNFLREKERRANVYSELRQKLAQNYSH